MGALAHKLAPLLAILAPSVGLGEAEADVGKMRGILVEAMRAGPLVSPEEAAEHGIVLIRHPLEVLLAEPDSRLSANAHAVHAVREEEPAVWVHEPPLAVHLLGAEEPRGLQLRTLRPAAPLVGAGNRALPVRGEPGLLRAPRLLKVLLVMHLPRPVVVLELPEAVHERQERRRVERLHRILPSGGDRHAPHAEAARRAILHEEDVERAGTREVEPAAALRGLAAARNGLTVHALQCERSIQLPRHRAHLRHDLARRVRRKGHAASWTRSLAVLALHA